MSAKKSKFQGLFEDEQIEDAPSPPQESSTVAPTVPEEILEPRNQEIEKPRSQDGNSNVTLRIKTNYEIREDYVRAFKVMAADERRKIYQLLEEAMKDFLVKRGKITPE
jgi:hypothetical protein